MTSYCITSSSCSARIKFCFPRISPTAKAGKTQRWKSSNGRIFPKRKRKSCCTTTPYGFSVNPSPDYSPYGEKASHTVKRGAATLGSKRSSRLSRCKRLKKQSGAVGRSAAIEPLEPFDQLHC